MCFNFSNVVIFIRGKILLIFYFRSVTNWSGLIEGTESSIQQAYLSLIANSEHFVYIENQFFVSMINSSYVKNGVCKAIYERIVRAHK